MFGDDPFIGQRLNVVVNLNARCLREKKARIFLAGYMLDVKRRPAIFAEKCQQLFGPGHSLPDSNQLHGTAGEIIVLNVNENESGFHDVLRFIEYCRLKIC
jgi:hypothetical protein